MARPVWTGSISFGLVNVPVKAYTAVRDHDVHFHEVTSRGSRFVTARCRRPRAARSRATT